MEKDFYTDDFEQLLKDTTEDFRMYPSRKIWHSIYNDLHPAKKWPSFAVSLLLITAILYIGIDNNNSINADVDNVVLSTLSPAENNRATAQKGHASTKAAWQNVSTSTKPETRTTGTTSASTRTEENTNIQNIGRSTLPAGEQHFMRIELPAIVVVPAEDIAVPLGASGSAALRNETMVEAKLSPTGSVPGTSEISVSPLPAANLENDVRTRNVEKIVGAESLAPVKTLAAATTQTTTAAARPNEDKAWIENYAFHNARNGNKWKTKFSTLVYITPSVGYRVLNRNNSFEPVNALLIRSSATSVDADDAITQQAAMNLESGATAILDLSRRLRVKGGIQFNYTNYVSSAERLSHPTQTNLLLNDLGTGNTMLVPVSSTYGNKAGQQSMRLNNSTIQFSLPVGADYKLAGNDRIKWYIGATIQPTYVAGGNAYLVSSDYKNYVDMPSMLRTWNLNAGFESFVSYKTKGGSVINFGPQFRYQLLSTYSSKYTYTENLYNVGVKVGITRKF